jgi:hypothetical protein
MTYGITAHYHYAECHISFTVMLNVIMLSAVALKTRPKFCHIN